MHCIIYKLNFQEKNLNLDLASDLEIRGSNPGPGSNFSFENLINKFIYCHHKCRYYRKLSSLKVKWYNSSGIC